MDRSDRNTVAVVIACHDAARSIGAAVQSALAQGETAEVFVIDDASSDGSLEAAAAADDGTGRLTLLRQPINRGPAATRNLAFARASSTWLAVLDADDRYLPGRFTAMLRHADAVDLIADDPWRVSQEAIHGPREAVIGVDTASLISFAAFVEGNVSAPRRPGREWGYVKPLLRRRFLERHGLRYQEAMRLGEDYELVARALALGARFLLLPPQGYLCVVRSGSLSQRHGADDLRQLRDCDAELATLPGLGSADLKALRRHAASIDARLQWRLLQAALQSGDVRGAMTWLRRPWPVPAQVAWLGWWRLIDRCLWSQRCRPRSR